jgi:GNAT superfamily N-acetyltransferase
MNAIEQSTRTSRITISALGVEPHLQGRSLAQLMAPILERCTANGPGPPESSKEKNLPLYERNGFRVTEKFQVPNAPGDLAHVAGPALNAKEFR